MNSRKNLGIRLTVFVLMPLLALAVPATGRTIYVDPNGSADFTSIQAAINDANLIDDEIEVAPGTYNEAINFNGKAVRLYSNSGPEMTTIDASGLNSSVVTCNSGEDVNTILEGFTITGGNAVSGGGMNNYNGSSPTVTNCTFSGNSASAYGGGMNNTGSSPTVVNCQFLGNSANTGGGMSNGDGSNPTVTNCTFSGNVGVVSVGGMFNISSSPIVTNCIFSDNETNGPGGGMYNDNSSPDVDDCNFSGNHADGSGGGMNNHNNSSPTVTNCTFTGNQGGLSIGDGGGMYNDNSSPKVINCNFTGNSSKYAGGGMDNRNSSDPNVDGCTFSQNTAGSNGGGMNNDNSSPDVNDCHFSENEASSRGGGMSNYNNSSPMVTNCIFEYNWASDRAGGLYSEKGSPAVSRCTFRSNTAANGAGMFNDNTNGGGSPTVDDCTFTGNSAVDWGGGLFNYRSDATVTNCTFTSNKTGNQGGGIENYYCLPTLTNCMFSGNEAAYGGGICNYYGGPRVTNCTLGGNTASVSGGGIYNYASSTPTLINCILWGNTPDGIFGGAIVTYSNVQGGWGNPDDHNIDADPLFINADGNDLRLGGCSPCVDAGDNGATGLPTTDLVGNPRFVDDKGIVDTGAGTKPIVDMGAYERQTDSTIGQVHNITRVGVVTYCRIQEAIDDANDGDVIEVDPGTYDPIYFTGPAIAIRIYSTHGPNVTIIDAGGIGTAVTCTGGQGPDTILEGFTITGGTGTTVGSYKHGGGMYCRNSSPTVKSCNFTANRATGDGGGMYNDNSSPMVIDCNFAGNSAAFAGGGMDNRNGSDPNVDGCAFNQNMAGTHGGGMNNNNSSPDVSECHFSDNAATGGSGGGMHNEYYSSPTVTNCNFSRNWAKEYGGGMVNYYNSSPTVVNCQFFGNAGNTGGGMSNSTSSSPTVTNCTFSGNRGSLNIGGMGNHHNSNPTVTNCILWGDTPDEIANEYGSNPNVTYSDWQGGTGQPWFGTGCIDSDPLFVNTTRVDLRLASYASPCVDAGDNSVVTEPNDLAGNPRVVDGDEDGTATVDMGAYEFNGGPVHNLRLNRSYLSIQAAIDDANDDQIEVGPGTYYEAINFGGKAIRLYSSGGPTVTTIDGDDNYHVVQCISGEGPNTILEGFTVTGGNADGTGEPNDRGGGMYCYGSRPTVTDCIFTSNSARYGGGMCNRFASPALINCSFCGNDANNGGGAILNQENSQPNLTNCSLSGNDANNGGGIYNVASNPTLTNCILWGDEPNEIVDTSSMSLVTYSAVEGGWSGDGNINQNPLLRNIDGGDLSLTPWSPCIDAGSNDVVGPNSTDITSLSRLVDGDCDGTVTVDMGAHEFRHGYGGDFDSSCLVNMADYAVLAWAWLASPQSENWDPVCDISIPADGRIDNNDLKVVAGSWLNYIDTPITCDANRLKDEFGLDAVCAAAVLSAAPCAYSPNNVAQALYDVGYSAAGAYKALTQVCGMTDGFPIEQLLYSLGYPPEEYLESTALPFVKKFAPVLYFDKAHKGLPMSAQVYFQTMMNPYADSTSGTITWTTPWHGPCGKPGVIWIVGRDESNCGMQNNDFSTLINGEIPTYYKVISDIDSDVDTGDKGRLRIAYWWFYGFQRYCNSYPLTDPGEHHGDWENIIVTTDPDRIRADAVTYGFHGDWYTRQWGGFDRVRDRPVAYVGKLAHGCYHSRENEGFGYDGTSMHPWHCCEYADFRNPIDNSKWKKTYDNLVSLRGSEPWMSADRIGSLYEFYGKEYEISQWRWGPHISYCDDWLFDCLNWTHVYACGTHPTASGLNWTLQSCSAQGCEGCVVGDCWYSDCITGNVNPDQGWPWGGGAASSAGESASPATGGAVASCGRCGASRFSALARLGNYWLATP